MVPNRPTIKVNLQADFLEEDRRRLRESPPLSRECRWEGLGSCGWIHWESRNDLLWKCSRVKHSNTLRFYRFSHSLVRFSRICIYGTHISLSVRFHCQFRSRKKPFYQAVLIVRSESDDSNWVPLAVVNSVASSLMIYGLGSRDLGNNRRVNNSKLTHPNGLLMIANASNFPWAYAPMMPQS